MDFPFLVLIFAVTLLGENWGCSQDYNNSSDSVRIRCINISSISSLSNLTVKSATHQFIDIKKSNIPTLPQSSFLSFPNAKVLFLESLGIKVIIPGAFNGIEKLVKLFLNDNELGELTVGVFNSLRNLEYLDLNHNRIHRIENFAFRGVENLQKLYLRLNNISKIESEWFETQTRLKSLALLGNPLSEFSGVSLPNLTYLELSFCDVTMVNLTQLPKVTNLQLGFNQFESLEPSLLNSTKKLEILGLGHNHILTIYKNTFKGLTKLTSLSLNHNNITRIEPSLFQDLEQLRFLDLSHNNIEEFAFGTFDKLAELKDLDISYNKFKILHQYTFYSMSRLDELNFGYNQISSFEIEDLLIYLTNLKSVSLDGNVWNCKNLASIYRFFKNRRVKVVAGENLDSDNVNGIKCSNLQITSINSTNNNDRKQDSLHDDPKNCANPLISKIFLIAFITFQFINY